MTQEHLSEANKVFDEIWQLKALIVHEQRTQINIEWMDSEPRKDLIQFYNNQLNIQIARAEAKMESL